jgi:hypothetical protein
MPEELPANTETPETERNARPMSETGQGVASQSASGQRQVTPSSMLARRPLAQSTFASCSEKVSLPTVRALLPALSAECVRKLRREGGTRSATGCGSGKS